MADVLETARHTYAVAYVTAACTSAVLYDYVLTVGDEIRCVWPSRMTIPKILFLINRYIIIPMLLFTAIASMRNHLSSGFCNFYLKWLLAIITAANCVMGGILLVRVIALYHDHRTVIAIARFLFAGNILVSEFRIPDSDLSGGTIALVGLSIKYITGQKIYVLQNLNVLPGCFPSSAPDFLIAYWVIPIITESVLFALVLWRVISWSRAMGVSPILYLMARDSAIYFAIIFALLLISLLTFLLASTSLATLFITPVITTGCIAGSRILLNLRGLKGPGEDSEDKEMEMTHRNHDDSHSIRVRPGDQASDLQASYTTTHTSSYFLSTWTSEALGDSDKFAGQYREVYDPSSHRNAIDSLSL